MFLLGTMEDAQEPGILFIPGSQIFLIRSISHEYNVVLIAMFWFLLLQLTKIICHDYVFLMTEGTGFDCVLEPAFH